MYFGSYQFLENEIGQLYIAFCKDANGNRYEFQVHIDGISLVKYFDNKPNVLWNIKA